MTNEKIKEVLERLGLPVFKDEAQTISDYNYFVFTESAIRERDCRYYQNIEVIWINEKFSNNNYFEIDIIQAMKGIGLAFIDGNYGFLRKANTEDYVNTLTLTFARPIKKNG